MTTEEKIRKIINKNLFTSKDMKSAMDYSIKEIASLFEPYKKLIEAQDEYNAYLKTRRCYDPIIQATYDTKIAELKKEIEKNERD